MSDFFVLLSILNIALAGYAGVTNQDPWKIMASAAIFALLAIAAKKGGSRE